MALWPVSSISQTATLLPNGMQQFFDNNGNPLSSGMVDFYVPNTLTRKNTWTDSGETITNTNPVVLDGAGRAIIYGDGSYRQILKDSSLNLIWDKVVSSFASGSTIITTGDGDQVGTVKPWAGILAPNQYVFANGQEISRVTFSILFTAITQILSVACTTSSATITGVSDTTQIPIGAKIELSCVPPGTTVSSKTSTTVTLSNPSNVTLNASATFFPFGNGNGTTTFNLPDLRGYVVAGRPNMGGTASTNLTAAFFGNTPAATGATGGLQSSTLIASNLPPYTPTGTVSLGFNDPGHVHTTPTGITASAGPVLQALASAVTSTSTTSSSTTGITFSPSFTGVAQGGTSVPFANIQPTITLNYIIKVTPDTSAQQASGVASLGGQTGAIGCSTGIICTGNNVSTDPNLLSLLAFAQNGTGAISRTAQNKLTDVISVLDFGAVCNGSTDDTTALNNAVNNVGNGQTIVIKGTACKITAPIIITKNITLRCANSDQTVAGNIIQTTTSSNAFNIRSGYVTIDGCSIAMAGSPSGTATGIAVGDDAIRKVSGGSFTNTSTTLLCSTCTFTSADVGKGIYAGGAGVAGAPLFTSISAIIDTTHVTMANPAGTTNAALTFGYGFNYQEIVLKDVQVYNFINGINIVAATQYHIRHSYVLGANPLILQNILWGDQGDGTVVESTFVASVAGSFNTVNYTSGGGLRFENNKVLAQAAISNCFLINWGNESSVGPFVVGNSIEGGCVNGINIAGSQAIHSGIINGNEIGVNGTGILAAPSAATPAWSITGNVVRTSNNNTGMSLTNMTGINIDNNTIQNTDGSASGTAYVIGSTSSGAIRIGFTTETFATISNASANFLIDDQQGLPFAKLPSVAQNGSRILITDGFLGSNPCGGGGSGAQAIRLNGIWTCGSFTVSAFSVTKGGTDQTGIASATFTALTWPTVVYNINSNFASNAWTPPAGKVSLFAAFNATGTITTGAQTAVAIFKNGVGFRQNLNASATNDASVSVYMEDVASGSDVYTAQAFITTSAGTATVQGATNVTYFGGHWISP